MVISSKFRYVYKFLLFLYPQYFTKITGEYFNIEPKTVKFDNNETKVHVKITVVNDVVEEGYENFTLQLSYNEVSNNGAVDIVREYATVSIEDDDG